MYMYEVCIFMYVEIVLHTNRLYDICHAKFHMFYSRYATILLTLSLHWRILKNRMSWSFIAMTITTFHQPLPSHLKNDAWPKRTCWSKIKLIARMGLWRGWMRCSKDARSQTISRKWWSLVETCVDCSWRSRYLLWILHGIWRVLYTIRRNCDNHIKGVIYVYKHRQSMLFPVEATAMLRLKPPWHRTWSHNGVHFRY